MMPEASDNGSQPYSRAFRHREIDIIGSNSIPAISQPLWGQLYGWLPLSNAYGISSSEKQPISIILQLFLALENKAHSMYIGIFLHHKTKYIQCTSPFPCIKKYTLYLTGFYSMVRQNTPNYISSIYNLTIRIRIMKTKHVQSPYRTTESGGATTTPPYFNSYKVMM